MHSDFGDGVVVAASLLFPSLVVLHHKRTHTHTLLSLSPSHTRTHQETEEGLQDLKERLALEREALLSERTAVEDQLQRLQSDIDAERQQSRDLEDKCRFFSSASGEEQEQELEQFDHKSVPVPPSHSSSFPPSSLPFPTLFLSSISPSTITQC